MSTNHIKACTIGVFISCLLLSTPLMMAGTPLTQTTPVATQDDLVFTHIPANGLYWNTHKIANFPVALFLRLRGGKLTDYGGSVTGTNISRVELYAEGYLMITYTSPPYSWSTPGMHVRILGATPTLTAKVYLTTGGVVWDNMTIYRLF
jgi:hypothetical protein